MKNTNFNDGDTKTMKTMTSKDKKQAFIESFSPELVTETIAFLEKCVGSKETSPLQKEFALSLFKELNKLV